MQNSFAFSTTIDSKFKWGTLKEQLAKAEIAGKIHADPTGLIATGYENSIAQMSAKCENIYKPMIYIDKLAISHYRKRMKQAAGQSVRSSNRYGAAVNAACTSR